MPDSTGCAGKGGFQHGCVGKGGFQQGCADKGGGGVPNTNNKDPPLRRLVKSGCPFPFH